MIFFSHRPLMTIQGIILKIHNLPWIALLQELTLASRNLWWKTLNFCNTFLKQNCVWNRIQLNKITLREIERALEWKINIKENRTIWNYYRVCHGSWPLRSEKCMLGNTNACRQSKICSPGNTNRCAWALNFGEFSGLNIIKKHR